MGIKELQRIIVFALWDAEMKGTRAYEGKIVTRYPDGREYVITIAEVEEQ